MLKLGGPLAGAVKNSQNVDFVIADAVGNNIRRARNNQFAGACDPSGAAQSGIPLQQIDRFANGLNQAGRGLRFIAGDEFRFGIQIRKCAHQPSNAHAASTS